MNHYRNKKIPRDFELPSLKYIKPHVRKTQKEAAWDTIIKPTLDNEELQQHFTQLAEPQPNQPE